MNEDPHTTYCGNIAKGEKRCMHCGQVGEYPFCRDGGKLPMGGVAKSLCLQSFKVLARQQQRIGVGLSKEQAFVLENEEVFSEWQKGLPTVEI